MTNRLFTFALVCLMSVFVQAGDIPSVDALLDRIGGQGTNQRIVTRLDTSLSQNGNECFVLTSEGGKPVVEGSSVSAVTTGIGWYLNHYAHVNLSWNNGVHANLAKTKFPLPEVREQHLCDAQYRYYLNYCTFGYSMTTWGWERWQHEIDWMALHGVNMPLQIIGLETVWRNFLIRDCGYTEAQAEAFIPGPAYTAWWGMNNLYGWGGDGSDQSKGVTDNAWYERQQTLSRQIIAREKELGMQPVLPGFSAMMPAGFHGAESQGNWCAGFQRPFILDPNNADFQRLAADYYRELKVVMGESRYYSMDPFHEGGRISSGQYAEGYKAIYDAMNANCGQNSKWVIQQWQWAGYQRSCLTAVPEGRLIVLDLFSDGQPAMDQYNGYYPQEAVYCVIPNYGGRTGFFGRIPRMADNYFRFKHSYNTIHGIGAAPEAIEQTPVVYDLLFELPWMNGQKPDCDEWIRTYAQARYGIESADANAAWEMLLHSALDNQTSLQGPHEAVMCARPALNVQKVSTWGGSDIFYNKEQLVDAAKYLLKAGKAKGMTALGKENYSYDLCDITRQALTDYSKGLLESISKAYQSGATEPFKERRDQFLELMLDVDELLGTNRMFRLGNWTETARQAAGEVKGATTATPDWMECNNARQLITTWGSREAAVNGGLNDYSYRQWQGMLRDFYYPRWQYWFSHDMHAPEGGWSEMEWRWAHDKSLRYKAAPEGNTRTVAKRLIEKYL